MLVLHILLDRKRRVVPMRRLLLRVIPLRQQQEKGRKGKRSKSRHYLPLALSQRNLLSMTVFFGIEIDKNRSYIDGTIYPMLPALHLFTLFSCSCFFLAYLSEVAFEFSQKNSATSSSCHFFTFSESFTGAESAPPLRLLTILANSFVRNPEILP